MELQGTSFVLFNIWLINKIATVYFSSIFLKWIHLVNFNNQTDIAVDFWNIEYLVETKQLYFYAHPNTIYIPLYISKVMFFFY